MFTIIELQTNGNEIANIVQTAATREEAMSKFHTVLAAAAISTVEVHSCAVLTPEAAVIANESYHHVIGE